MLDNTKHQVTVVGLSLMLFTFLVGVWYGKS